MDGRRTRPGDVSDIAQIPDRVARQEAIEIVQCERSRVEVMIRLRLAFHEAYAVHLRYIPDKYQLPEGSFARYLVTVPDQYAEDVAVLARTVLDDLNNQLVPRWLQVMIEGKDSSALIEDRQPQWQNAALLSRQVIF